MNKELELESNDVYTSRIKLDPQSKMYSIEQLALCEKQSFIAGATSKYVEKQKLEFAIEQLNKLDSVLQAKVSLLLDMCDESSDKEFYSRKISGIKLAKEEIRRVIKELEQKLSEI